MRAITLITSVSMQMAAVCLWVALSVGKAHASIDNIRFQRLTLEQGLSQESVLSIFQDEQGYMWFGTQEGLNRFDGYQFKVFSHSDRQQNSLTADWVSSIIQDTNGDIWFGTSDGISVLDPTGQRFRSFHQRPTEPGSLGNDSILTLFIDSQKTIWVGTEGGLYRFDRVSQQFRLVPLKADRAADKARVWAMEEDSDGQLWIGTDGDGLYKLDLVSGEVAQFQADNSALSRRIRSLMFDASQQLWIGTYDKGIALLDKVTTQMAYFVHQAENPNTLSSNLVRDIYQDQSGNVWVATNKGLNRFNPTTLRFHHVRNETNNEYSLTDDNITTLFQDRGGVFWVGSYSGLNKWNTATANFNHYRVLTDQDQSLTSDAVTTFALMDEKHVWVGTLEGLNLLNMQNGQVRQFLSDPQDPSSLSSNRVMSLLHDSGDRVWVGTRSQGLELFSASQGKIASYQNDPERTDSLSANGITSIRRAGNNALWVSTYGGGLNLFNTETGKTIHYRHDPDDAGSIASDKILTLYQDKAGNLWIGTWGAGISVFNPNTEMAVHIKHQADNHRSLASNSVLAIHEDGEGNIWVGTQGGGLNKLSAANRARGQFNFERIGRYDGLPSNVVYGILEDNAGHLWLSSNRGLTKYNPQNRNLVNYDSSHGLQGNEFNLGASYRAPDGQMFFGGSNGATSFFPKLITPNAHVPPVVLTNFLRLNESFTPDSVMQSRNNIEISHQDYLIAFEFAGLDYASPSNNRYSYKLVGFDDAWIDAGDLRRATYTNLPAGDYVFRVKASNNDGVWNEQGANLALTVLPAPWRSWWAYTLYSLAGLFILAMIVRSYVSKLKKGAVYRAKLEREVEKRTTELRAANEQLLNASVTDQLTGLHNRRYLSNIIDRECAKVLRDLDKQQRIAGKLDSGQGPRLFCMMFDLDGFKPVNDTYGHDAGDQIICQISDLLREVCRQSDTLIRWGGDEFLIMGRVDNEDEAIQLAERLRQGIANKGFDIGLKQKLRLSCSIGYSFYPFAPQAPDAISWEQVQIIADRALYHSKDAGRNYWTGIVSQDTKPPVSLMSSLIASLEQVVTAGYVSITEPSKSTQSVLATEGRENNEKSTAQSVE